MGKAWSQSGNRQKNAGTQLAFSFLFGLEPYGRSQPTVRVGLPIQFSHIQTPLERSSEVCLLHSSRGQILLFVSHLASSRQCLNSQRKPGYAHPHANGSMFLRTTSHLYCKREKGASGGNRNGLRSA